MTDTPSREFSPRGVGLVASGLVGVGCGVGALPFYTLGVFVVPLQEAFDATRSQIQVAWFFVSIITALLSPAVGFLADRYGARPTGLFGLLGAGMGFIVLATLPSSLASFYVGAGILAIGGACASPVTWTRGITTWFNRNRGLALGLTLSGSGIAGALAPSYTASVITEYGWRGGYLALAVLPLLLALPLALVAYKPKRGTTVPGKPGSELSGQATPSLFQTICQWRFQLLLFCFVCVSIGIGGLITNFVPLLQDSGLSIEEAASYAGIIGLAVIVGRIGGGFLLDRYWAPGVVCCILILPVVTCLIALAGVFSPLGLSAAAICLGVAAGAEFDGIAYLTARYFNVSNYGKLYGLQFGAISLAAGLAPALFSWVFDTYGDYRFALLGSAVLFVLGSLPLLSLGRVQSQTSK